MKILLVNKFWYPKGGSERYAFLLKDLLESRGHEVATFGAEGAQHPLRYLWDRVAARRIEALLDEAKPDIAHLQNFTHQISPSILPVLRKHGVPIVWTLHDLDVFRPGYRNPNAWGRRAAAWVEYLLHHTILDVYRRNIDCIIAPSRFAADAVREWGWRGRVEVVPNFVPEEHANVTNADPNATNPGMAAAYSEHSNPDSDHSDVLPAYVRSPAIHP